MTKYQEKEHFDGSLQHSEVTKDRKDPVGETKCGMLIVIDDSKLDLVTQKKKL